jgi:hypothetical protein
VCVCLPSRRKRNCTRPRRRRAATGTRLQGTAQHEELRGRPRALAKAVRSPMPSTPMIRLFPAPCARSLDVHVTSSRTRMRIATGIMCAHARTAVDDPAVAGINKKIVQAAHVQQEGRYWPSPPIATGRGLWSMTMVMTMTNGHGPPAAMHACTHLPGTKL